MPDEIKVDEQAGIINVRMYGINSKDVLENSIKKMIEIHEEKHINRVFVDTREEEKSIDTLDSYDIFEHFPRDVRVALLVKEGQKTFNNIGFIETFAQNRGLMIKRVLSEHAALEWLNKS